MENKIRKNLLSLWGQREVKDGEYHVTELNRCLRKSYYERKDGLTSAPNGYMLNGTLLHKELPNLLNEIDKFKDAKYEVPVIDNTVNGLKIVGSADVLTADTVYDLKYSGSHFEKSIPEHYVMQLNTYAGIMNIKRCGIIHINSTTLQVSVVEFDYDPRMYELAKNRAMILHYALKVGVSPPGPAFDWECKYRKVYCDYKDKCKELMIGFDGCGLEKTLKGFMEEKE